VEEQVEITDQESSGDKLVTVYLPDNQVLRVFVFTGFYCYHAQHAVHQVQSQTVNLSFLLVLIPSDSTFNNSLNSAFSFVFLSFFVFQS